MNKETVIPAFPTIIRKDEKYIDEAGYGRVRNVAVSEPGISMRDYFAAKAIVHVIGLCTSYSRDAEEAYKIADAMMEARK